VSPSNGVDATRLCANLEVKGRVPQQYSNGTYIESCAWRDDNYKEEKA